MDITKFDEEIENINNSTPESYLSQIEKEVNNNNRIQLAGTQEGCSYDG